MLTLCRIFQLRISFLYSKCTSSRAKKGTEELMSRGEKKVEEEREDRKRLMYPSQQRSPPRLSSLGETDIRLRSSGSRNTDTQNLNGCLSESTE